MGSDPIFRFRGAIGRAEAPRPMAIRTGGEGGIRTPGDLATTPVFKTGPFNRSGTSPRFFSLSAWATVRNRLNPEYFAHNK